MTLFQAINIARQVKSYVNGGIVAWMLHMFYSDAVVMTSAIQKSKFARHSDCSKLREKEG